MINTLKAVCSMLIILSMCLTSANIYPLNLYIAVLPTIGWIYISCVWKDKSLIAMNVTALVIYIIGILNYVTSL
jgi:hypothetical protein